MDAERISAGWMRYFRMAREMGSSLASIAIFSSVSSICIHCSEKNCVLKNFAGNSSGRAIKKTGG